MKLYSPRKEGMQKFLLREYEDAIIYFDKALENNPNDFEVYWKRGVAKSKLNKYSAAQEDFLKSERLRKEFNDLEAEKKAQVEEDIKFLSDEEDQINNASQIRYEDGNYAYMADKLSLLFSRFLNRKIKESQEEKELYLKLLKTKNDKDKTALENEYINSRKDISRLAFYRFFYRDFSNSISNLIKDSPFLNPLEIYCRRILVSSYYHFFDEKVSSIEIPKIKPDLIYKLLDYICSGEENWAKRGKRSVRECTDQIINELIINDIDLLLSKDPQAQLISYMLENTKFIEKYSSQGTKKYNSYGLRMDYVWKKEEFFNAFNYDKFKLIVNSALDYAIHNEELFYIKDLELIEF